MFEFEPRTEEELEARIQKAQEERMLPEGVYSGRINKAETAVSNNGHPQLILDTLLYHVDGRPPVPLKKWLTWGSDFGERMARHFFRSAKRLDIYESGKINAYEINGLLFLAEVKHRTYKKDGQDRKTLDITDFLEQKEQLSAPIIAEPFTDDEIPF